MNEAKFPHLSEVVNLAEALVEEQKLYKEKPTKAASKRMRAYLTAIKKYATEAKRELIAADKGC